HPDRAGGGTDRAVYWCVVHSTSKVSSTMYDMARGNSPGPARGNRRTGKKPAAAQPAPDEDGTKGASGVERFVAKLEDSLAEHVEKHERAADRKARQAQRNARQAERLERAAEKTAQKAAKFDQLADHLSALDVWTRPGPASRQPRFSRDE